MLISKIKESFINYFGNNQISEIENLFDDITIILWKNDNGKITYTFDNKENQYSNSLKKYLKNNWNNIVKEELDGFCLSNTKSPTIFVKFQVKDGKGILDNDVNFVIWTTTPWTIPANLAICLNASYNYALVETEKGKLIVLDTLVDELKPRINNWNEVEEYREKTKKKQLHKNKLKTIL